MKTLGNIIWVIFGGLHIALEYFIAGLILMITIIGIPFGKMHFRLAKLALSPSLWSRSNNISCRFCPIGRFRPMGRGVMCIVRR